VDNLHEEWRPVVGYEGWYSVSSLGRVRRDKSGNGTRAGKTLKAPPDVRGYPLACFCQDGEQHYHRVHRLVAEAFLGPCPAGLQVNHKDGDKLNNHVSNLEYVTPSENTRHAIRLGLWTPVGEAHHLSKLSEADVREIRRLRGKVTQQQLADRYGVSNSLISAIQLRQIWRHI
jgi:hypothetical protein